MIVYFSGTGNSYRVAKQLAALTQTGLAAMGTAAAQQAAAKEHEALGLVFPVYAWGLPAAVSQFVRSLPRRSGLPMPYVYAVLTCGDDIGRTDKLLCRALAERGWKLGAAFSVQMRNTYVCLPGFDTDTPAVEADKERRCQPRITDIARRVAARGGSNRDDVHPGAFPWLKSYVLRPLFNRFLTSDRLFHAERTRCTHCGRCAKNCPLDNIRLNADGLPEWSGRCTLCLRCYHGCPTHAIEYGIFTKGKGQVKINV